MKRSYLFSLAFLLSGVTACGENPEVCANGIDDDEDTLTDCEDLEECGASPACQENCGDGVDNNRDGAIDCADDQCVTACDESAQCADGIDNDQDGAEDCADSECSAQIFCQPEICNNNADDNGNGQIDCADPSCVQALNCIPDEICDDGLDNDKDGFVDCNDDDCANNADCLNNQCNDGLDNDDDVLTDAADPACQVPGASVESNDNQCSDGIDNDFDGSTDNNDSDCVTGHEANAAQLPDLIMLSDANDRCAIFDNNINGVCQPIVRNVNVSANDPEFQAGCFTGTGQRRIMEWSSIIGNIGNRPLVVGDTSDHLPIWSTVGSIGGQLEFFGWTRSFLRDNNNTVVAAGHKGSFCMIDLFEIVPGTPSIFNDCGNGQGINDGQGDVYSVGLPCQFIDITDDVPAGNYTLEVQTDFTNQLPESDYTNNSAFYDIVLP